MRTTVKYSGFSSEELSMILGSLENEQVFHRNIDWKPLSEEVKAGINSGELEFDRESVWLISHALDKTAESKWDIITALEESSIPVSDQLIQEKDSYYDLYEKVMTLIGK